MAALFTFITDRFHPETEPENPFNPIFGHSLASWLMQELDDSPIDASEIEPEDWGWYFDASLNNQHYLVGFTLIEEESSSLHEAIIQVEKSRSFWQKLTGSNKLEKNDPFLELIQLVLFNSVGEPNVEITYAA